MPKMDRNLDVAEVELRSIDREERHLNSSFHKIATPPHLLTKSDVPFRRLSDTVYM